MAQVGTLTVDLIAQTASFNANISKAAANLNSNAARMNRSLQGVQTRVDGMAKAARAASFALAGVGFAQMVKSSLDYAGSLKETAQQLGVTAEQLQVYNFIGSQVGVTNEDMQKGLAKLTLSLGQAEAGAGKQGKAFEALGISVRDANGQVLTAGEALPKIADALAKVQDPAQRAAVEVALFGKAGQKLDTVLTGGAKGIADYAKAAENAGLVISDSLIDKADMAADRVAALTAQLKVSFARVVAENADAILGLANALAKVAGYGLQALTVLDKIGRALNKGTNPFERIQALSEEFRSGKARVELAQTAGAGKAGGKPKRLSGQAAIDSYLKSVGAPTFGTLKKPIPAGVELPDFLATGGGGGGGSRKGRSGPSADSLRDKALRDAEMFASELARLDMDLLSAKRDNLGDLTLIADLDRQQLTIETEQLKAGIAADAATGKYTAAQAEQLTVKIDQVKAEKLLTIKTEELERQAGDLLNLAIAQNDNQKDLLGAQEQLAITQEDRRKIQLNLLDLERKEEELKQRNIIALSKSPAERLAAQQRLEAMPGIYEARGQSVRDQTAGPLEAYLKSTDPATIKERVESLQLDQLLAVRDGINSAITSALGIENPLLKGLIDIFLEQVLIRPIAEALRKAQSSQGGSGDVLGQIIGIGIGIATGGMSPQGIANSNMTVGGTIAGNPSIFASGGAVRGPGTATSDSIMARLSNGEFVMSAKAVQRLGVGNLDMLNKGGHPKFATGGYVGKMPPVQPANDGGHSFHFHFSGEVSARQARETGSQAGREALRVINGPLRKAS